jgi:hypothetical protein
VSIIPKAPPARSARSGHLVTDGPASDCTEAAARPQLAAIVAASLAGSLSYASSVVLLDRLGSVLPVPSPKLSVRRPKAAEQRQ